MTDLSQITVSEPVATVRHGRDQHDNGLLTVDWHSLPPVGTKLYTHPPSERVLELVEAACGLLAESIYFTKQRADERGDSYGVGTDGEQRMRAALAAFQKDAALAAEGLKEGG